MFWVADGPDFPVWGLQAHSAEVAAGRAMMMTKEWDLVVASGGRRASRHCLESVVRDRGLRE